MKYNQFLKSSLGKLQALDQQPLVRQLAYFRLEQDAYEFERTLIAQFGRRVDGSGCLDNIDPGFRNRLGFKGRRHSAASITRMTGKKRTEATRSLMRKPKSPAHAEKIRNATRLLNSRSADWKIMSPTGEIFLVRNMNKFCTLHSLNPTPIYNSLRHHRPVARGVSRGWQALSKISIFNNFTD